MSQPAKSISRAPSATWRVGQRGLVRPRRSTAVGHGQAVARRSAGGRRRHRSTAARAPIRVGRGRRAPARSRRSASSPASSKRDPADLLELVVVARRGRRRSAPSGSSGPSCGCACRDWTNQYSIESSGAGDPDLEPGLLGDLAEGGLLGRLARVRACPWAASRSSRRARAGGCRRRARDVRPHGGPRCRPRTWRSRSSGVPRRRGGARSTARARCDRSGPNASGRAGRGRPPWTDGRAGRGPRQPARSWASGLAPDAVQHGGSRSPRRRRRQRRQGRAGARGRDWTDGRIWPPAEPRTWPRCCVPWARNGTAFSRALQAPHRARRHGLRRLRCEGATVRRKVDLPAGRGDVQVAARPARGPAGRRGARSASRRRRGSSVRSGRPGCPRARALPSVPSMSGP